MEGLAASILGFDAHFGKLRPRSDGSQRLGRGLDAPDELDGLAR